MNLKECDCCGKIMTQAEANCTLMKFGNFKETEWQYDLCAGCADKLENEFMRAQGEALKRLKEGKK